MSAETLAQRCATMENMNELRIVIHGKMTSSNHFKAADRTGKLRKTAEAREDARRVREIATVAATSAAWEIPEAVAVTLYAFNSRLDADNVSKVPFDSLKGIAWRDDADVLDFRIVRGWDREGERYEIVVRPTEDRRPGRRGSKTGGAKRSPFSGFSNGQLLTFEQRDVVLRKAGVR